MEIKITGKSSKLLLLLAILQLFSDSLCQSPAYRPPLKISGRDLYLKVGENDTLVIESTSSFADIFANVTSPTYLVFRYSVATKDELYIQPLANISLKRPDFINGTSVPVLAKKAGRLIVTSDILPSVENYTGAEIFFRVSIFKLAFLNVFCEIVGWIYFAAWSISFYPQIFQNYQRKSVRGLSFEFVFLNITGFTVYAVYNVGLFWFSSVQKEYFVNDPTGSIPVQINDVVFAVHAVFASGITGIQCLIYDRGSQTISYYGSSLLGTIYAILFVLFVVSVSNAITWLSFLEGCSYIKLFITLVKYVPQAYLNYTRKSTSGWCIGNVLLDFTGGVFSVLQMILIAYNHDDWYSIFGDFTKFGLGAFSILFDLFFMVQHYILYRSHREYEPIEGYPDPLLNPHEDMVTSNNINNSFDDGTENQRSRSASVDSAKIPKYNTIEDDSDN